MEQSPKSRNEFRPSRRGFILGAAAVTASAAAADDARWVYALAYDNDLRRQRVILTRTRRQSAGPLHTETVLTWRRSTFGPRATFKLQPSWGQPKNGVSEIEKWSLTIRNASFPGTDEFAIVFELEPGSADWTIRARSQFFWGGGVDVNSDKIALTAFAPAGSGLERSAQPRTLPLSFPIPHAGPRRSGAANAMLRVLFGDRVEAQGPAFLQLDRDAHWSVRARDDKLPFDALTFGFSFLRIDLFATATDPNGVTTLATETDTSQPAEWLFEHASPEALRDQPRAKRKPGLYGRISEILPVGGAHGKMRRFVFASTSLPGAAGRRLTVPIHLDGSDRDVEAAALRHWGDPVHTVAGYRRAAGPGRKHLRGLGQLWLETDELQNKAASHREGPFDIASFEVTRQRERGSDRVATRLHAYPPDKEWLASTSSGDMVLGGLPHMDGTVETSAAAPIQALAFDRPKGADIEERILASLKLRLRLCEAAVALPENREPTSAGRPSRHSSRLRFDDAEALFYCPALEPQPESSADATVPVGPAVERGGSAILSLDRAQLTLQRPQDLLSLTYRFSGLALQIPWQSGTSASLGPAGVFDSCRMPRQDVDKGLHPQRDTRPLLVVEFPPQHVLEQAWFVQTVQPPELPKLNMSGWAQEDRQATDAALALLRQPKRSKARQDDGATTTAAERLQARRRIHAILKRQPPGEDNKLLNDLLPDFENRTAEARLPAEQRLYVGAEFLDPDARRIANMVAADIAQKAAGRPAPVSLTLSERRALVEDTARGMRDYLDGLDPGRLAGLSTINGAEVTFPDTAFDQLVQNGTPATDDRKQAVRQLLTLRAAAAIRRDEAALAAAQPDPVRGRIAGRSRIAFRINCDDHRPERQGGRVPFTVEGLTDWSSFDMAVVRRAERLMAEPAEGQRLPPRWLRRASADEADKLLFQGIRPGDHRTRRKDADPRSGALRAAAERLADIHANLKDPPGPFETALELPARLFLSPAQDATWRTPRPAVWREAAAARYDRWRLAKDGGVRDLGPKPLEHPDLLAFQDLWTASLADVGRPDDDSVEGKARRVAGGVRAVWSPDFRPQALLSRDAPGPPPRGPHAPWQIPMDAGLRRAFKAVKSPEECAAEAALETAARAAEAAQCPDAPAVPDTFRAPLDAYDRHELVVLTSAHGLPVRGRRNAAGQIVSDGSQITPPNGFALSDALPERIGELPRENEQDRRQTRDLSAIYRPPALALNELSLSAMGGSLDLDTSFEPPASVILRSGQGAFDALSIERWRQRTVIGRDVSVEVVYKGFLFPLGHRCSFVKLTERTFRCGYNGGPVAVLAQRMFLRVGAPRKDFRAYGQPNGGRRWPAQHVEILTVKTPDIVDPMDQTSGDGGSRNGRISLKLQPGPGPSESKAQEGTGLCFWPRIAPRDGAEVMFEMRFDGEGVATRLPLIFVDNTAANDPQTIAALVAYYNSLQVKPVEPNAAPVADETVALAAGPSRRLSRLGQSVRMAPDLKPDDTSYECAWWDIGVEGRQSASPDGSGNLINLANGNYVLDSLMNGLDQPPFYPFVAAAKLRLAQLERLTGTGPHWTVAAYEGTYVRDGFPMRRAITAGEVSAPGRDVATPERMEGGRDPEDGIFLRVMDAYLGNRAAAIRVDLDGRGERAGAVAQPNQVLVGLSRTRGLVGYDRKPGSTDPGDPKGGSQDCLVSLQRAPAPRSDAAPQRTAEPARAAPPVRETPGRTPVLAIDGPGGPAGDFLANLFPPDAKLLGLVPLRLVVKVVTATLATQPRLREAVDYGAGAVAGAAEAARGLLTDTVLEPAKELIGRVREEWLRLSLRLGDKSNNLAAAFPDLAGDLAALEEALGKAIESPSDADFLAALSPIHETGRRLGRTFDRIAQDPLAVALDIARIGEIRKLIDGVRTIHTMLTSDGAVPPAFWSALEELIQADERVDQFFSTPVPLLPTGIEQEFRNAARSALKSGLGAALTRLKRENLHGLFSEPAIGEAGDAFATSFKAELKRRANQAGLTAEVKQALAALATEIEAAATDKVFALVSMLPPKTITAVAKLRSKLPLALSAKETSRTRLDAGLAVVTAALDLVGAPRWIAEATDATCNQARAIVRAVATHWLPPAGFSIENILEPAREALRSAADELENAAAPAAKLGSQLRELAGDRVLDLAVSRLLSALRRVADVLAAAPACRLEAVNLAGLREIELRAAAASAAGRALLDRAEEAARAVHASEAQLAKDAKTKAAKALARLAHVLASEAEKVFGGEISPVKDAFAELGKPPLDRLKPVLDRAIATLTDSGLAELRSAGRELRVLSEAAEPKLDEILAPLAAARSAAGRLIEARRALQDAIDDVPAALLGQATAAASESLGLIFEPALQMLASYVLAPAIGLLDTIRNAVEKIREEVTNARKGQAVIDYALTALERQLSAADLFRIDYPAADGRPASADGFFADLTALRQARAALTGHESPFPRRLALAQAELEKLAPDADEPGTESQRPPAIVALVQRFSQIDGSLLRAAALDALNMDGFKREIEMLIRELIPTRRTLSYDLDVELGEVGKFFTPEEGSKLTLSAVTMIDLLHATAPKVQVNGAIGPFKVTLFGPFEAVILHFKGVTFRSDGGSQKLDVAFGEVEIGSHAKFLEQLQPWLSPGEDGSGLFRRALDKLPGLEVGYGINLGTFGVGALSFSNVSLNAALRLPFTNTPAEIVISIGRVDAPFLISSTIFGGGGYLALTATAERFLGLEANFSYGGVFAFGFGPLVGQGQITVGVYLNQRVGRPIEIGSTFQVRGAAQIACFGIMASLYVRLTMQPEGPGSNRMLMRGMAIFSFSFDLGIHTISFRVNVERNEGARMGESGGPNGQTGAAQPTSPPPRAQPSAQRADAGPTLDGREFGYAALGPDEAKPPRVAWLKCEDDLPAPEDLQRSRRYFVRRAEQARAFLLPV